MQAVKNVIEQLSGRRAFRLSDRLFVWLAVKPFNLTSDLLTIYPAIKTDGRSAIQTLKHSNIQATGLTDVMTADCVAKQPNYQTDNQPYV